MPVLGRQGCQSSRVSIAWQTKPEMPPVQQQSRIDLQVLKAQMVKRIGSERANQYFTHFKSYVSLKSSKQELDKLVVLAIGIENIGLHNEIIKAILSNAIKSETPPPALLIKETTRPVKVVGKNSLLEFPPPRDAVSRLACLTAKTTSSLSNGNSFSVPHKKDGLPDGNVNEEMQSAGVDLHRPSQGLQSAAEQSEADPDGGSVRLTKRPRVMLTPSSPDMDMGNTNLVLHQSHNTMVLKDDYRQWDNGLIRAPPFYTGPASKTSYVGLTGLYSQVLLEKGEEKDIYDLPDTETLQRRMEHIAAVEGLEGVLQNCAEVLNQGLDTFLRGLIQSCIYLVRSSEQESPIFKQDRDTRTTVLRSKKDGDSFGREAAECSINNAFQPLHSNETQGPSLGKDEKSSPGTVSLLDFKAAMELNPQQLGEDWPLQLERILFRSFE